MDTAKEYGRCFHSDISKFLKFGIMPATDRALFLDIKNKLAQKKWTFLESEFTVDHDNVNGRMDALFEKHRRNKKIYAIVDWKCTRRKICLSKGIGQTFSWSQKDRPVFQLNLYRYLYKRSINEEHGSDDGRLVDVELYIGNVVRSKIYFRKCMDLGDAFIERSILNFKLLRGIPRSLGTRDEIR